MDTKNLEYSEVPFQCIFNEFGFLLDISSKINSDTLSEAALLHPKIIHYFETHYIPVVENDKLVRPLFLYDYSLFI